MVDLKWYKISNIDFENDVPNGTQLKLKNSVKYNVNYMDAERRCVSKLEFRIGDENLQPFSIKLEMEAMFTYDEFDEKPYIHTASFDHLFPFIRQSVNSLTTMAGMPGLLIPLMKLEENEVALGKPKEETEEPLN
ncbi:MAG: protein-export chaperone SecB [Eubacterium sp.]|nr:protein-export chaperone SecB [Eubacterium sp.]